jgi:hypothetical protein
VSATSIWVPISSAVAALFGAGFGATLQGRYGTAAWRRQIRLEAYTRFLNATHDFDFLLRESLDTINESNFDQKQHALEEARRELMSAATQVDIAGPKRVQKILDPAADAARAITRDMQNPNLFIPVARTYRETNIRRYDKYEIWLVTVEQLASELRMFLKTD